MTVAGTETNVPLLVLPMLLTCSTYSILSFIQQILTESSYYIQAELHMDMPAPFAPFPISPLSFPPFFTPLSLSSLSPAPCFPDFYLCEARPPSSPREGSLAESLKPRGHVAYLELAQRAPELKLSSNVVWPTKHMYVALSI